MDRDDEFFKAQYQSLREEIKDSKNRSFQTLTIGFTLLPAAQVLGLKIESSAFIVIIPLLIITFAMIFLSQNHEIMRCGRFIRICIEPRVSKVPGWETYLESERLCNNSDFNTRTVDQYIIYAFYVLFFIYYLTASILGVVWISKYKSSGYFSHLFAMFYIFCGVGFGVFLNKNLRKATTTDEREGSKTVLSTITKQLQVDDVN